jgi:hypothetical protein
VGQKASEAQLMRVGGWDVKRNFKIRENKKRGINPLLKILSPDN